MAWMFRQLIIVVAGAYLLAGIPVAFVALLGRLSPVYAFPRQTLFVYWGWFAVIVTASAIAVAAI
jgi:hypothetical protein